jgi:hypothetical protein
VPPIFQPELAAGAVHWAAHHRRRELVVGGSALKAIWGNKVAPGFADWYLARTGFDSQQIADVPVDGRAGNLFEPVEGASATHGIFDDEARSSSRQLWLTTHRRLFAAAAAAAALGAGALRRGR